MRYKERGLIHTVRDKQAPEHAAESDKSVGNGKCMNAKKAMDLYGSEVRTRLRHHLSVPSQYREVGPWV